MRTTATWVVLRVGNASHGGVLSMVTSFLLTLLLVLWGLPQAGAERIVLGEDAYPDAQPTPEELRLVEQRYGVCGIVNPFDKTCRASRNVNAEWAALTAAALLANQREHFNDCFAAMRAMDRFVQGLIISTDRAVTIWQPGAQQQFNAAKVQWDAAKACWQKETP